MKSVTTQCMLLRRKTVKTLKRLNRQILDILAFSEDREDKMNDGVDMLSKLIGCDVYLLDDKLKMMAASNDDLEAEYFKQFQSYDLQRENIFLNNEYYIVSPLLCTRENIGMFVVKRSTEFLEMDIIIYEICRNFAIETLHNINRDRNFKKQRQIGIVKNSINSFSYSELHAICAIFTELGGEEGIVVASNVSQKYSVTRSVIVSALRKFESSGVIESRSLGAKGTFIKVLNPFLLDELELIKGDFIK